MNCTHMEMIDPSVQPATAGCEECLKEGAWWVRLRMCLVCGHVGCCDSSPNRHASAHFRSSGHPIIRSFEPGQENMRWCYIDDVVV